MKNILFIASEGVPFIKTGGLADVVGSLPKCINKEYFDVRVMIPKYMCMSQEMKDKITYNTHFYMDFNWKNEYVGLMESEVDGVKYYFIDNEFYFNRDEILGPILQYRMEENLPTFFTSNLTLEELENNLSVTSSGVDKVKARRIIERIKQLTVDIQLVSKNRRN